jgi:hypothetical protein
MSRLAHATYGAPGFDREKEDQLQQDQIHIREIKKIQAERGISYHEAFNIYFLGEIHKAPNQEPQP